MDPLVIRNVLPVPLGVDEAAATEPVDVLVEDGVVRRMGTDLPDVDDARVHDADGRWMIPGLWDHHVHLGQVAMTTSRLDLSTARSPEEVTFFVQERLSYAPDKPLVGFGHRSATWPRKPTVAELDEVSDGVPIVLISGDAHHAWLNSPALRGLGLAPRNEVVRESEWFEAYGRLEGLIGREATPEAYRTVQAEAASRGVVGLVDFEFTGGADDWAGRWAEGVDLLRIRMATYADGLDAVLDAALRSGDTIPDTGLVTMGPLKVISDGSLNTRTAWCCAPYTNGDDLIHPFGYANQTVEELRKLMVRATTGGLEVAVHAIGDAAVHEALLSFAATGARGSIEHAQLIDPADVPRLAASGLRASVQPAHLLDDRDVSEHCWADRLDRCFALRWMHDAGTRMHLGSDAPVAPLDPWLAMAAAVHRSADERDPWNPGQSLTAREALAASTDGWGTVAVGHPGDLVLLDADPLADVGDTGATSTHLRFMNVAATYVAGRLTAPLLS
ncbi:amidohydrolase family protein [Nocardioides sp. JQ2195]|uniref:amidohydrolase n=1 Tax=Nocardioides sp. JQ2195 TaxID=2592334 RepID=UPI00143E1FB1|nr:amidohydrolase family protein [Nocardioides sp. JQ2195]QIX27010.1 amidohydrolase family protein [Nocardioides sp. JQ2195]